MLDNNLSPWLTMTNSSVTDHVSILLMLDNNLSPENWDFINIWDIDCFNPSYAG